MHMADLFLRNIVSHLIVCLISLYGQASFKGKNVKGQASKYFNILIDIQRKI